MRKKITIQYNKKKNKTKKSQDKKRTKRKNKKQKTKNKKQKTKNNNKKQKKNKKKKKKKTKKKNKNKKKKKKQKKVNKYTKKVPNFNELVSDKDLLAFTEGCFEMLEMCSDSYFSSNWDHPEVFIEANRLVDPSHHTVKKLQTENELQDALQKNNYSLVVFSRENCPFCAQFKSQLERLAKINWMPIIEVVEQKCPNIINQYNVVNYPDIKLIGNNGEILKDYPQTAEKTAELITKFMYNCLECRGFFFFFHLFLFFLFSSSFLHFFISFSFFFFSDLV